MFIKDTNFHYNSLKQLNIYDNKSNNTKEKIYKNNRSKIPVKKIFRNYNLISKINNNYINDNKDTFFSDRKNNELKTYNLSINNKKKSLIKKRRIQSLEQLSIDKSLPLMNIMINNKIIKNIFVNKNSKLKISDRMNNNQIKKQNINNTYKFNDINKIKQNQYNDYNLTFQSNKGNNKIYNKNINISNIKFTSESNKSFLYNNFNKKKLLNCNNKIKQISPQKYYKENKIIVNKKYFDEYNNINNFYEISLRNNNIINQNKKNKKYQLNNFYSQTNIYETNYKTLREQISLFPIQDIDNKLSKLSYGKKINNNSNNNKINNHKSFNGIISSTYNNIYQNTEHNKIKNDLISSSSSSDISNELSAIAEDII